MRHQQIECSNVLQRLCIRTTNEICCRNANVETISKNQSGGLERGSVSTGGPGFDPKYHINGAQ